MTKKELMNKLFVVKRNITNCEYLITTNILIVAASIFACIIFALSISEPDQTTVIVSKVLLCVSIPATLALTVLCIISTVKNKKELKQLNKDKEELEEGLKLFTKKEIIE